MTAPVESGKEKLYLVDGLALVYRAHFAFINRPLINSKGLDTSAIYGFTLALLSLLEREKPEHITVVFDTSVKSFRNELYPAYKAHRPPMPPEIIQALDYIKDIVRAFDIPVLEVPDVEADDVIGTLARRAEEEGVDAIIVSPDKDFRQLVSPNISILRPAYRGESFDLYTEATFFEKYGVEPIKFIDILALLGDTSDNVPGVPGIGEKTAPKLIQDYGSVENLLDHAEEIKGKRVREGLLNHREMALLSKALVTILTDVELGLDWHTLKRTSPKMEQLARLFKELEFRSLLQRADQQVRQVAGGQLGLFEDATMEFDFGPYEAVQTLDEDAVDYAIVRNQDQLKTWVDELAQTERFSVDTETTSVAAMWAGLVGTSFAKIAGEARYVPDPLPDGSTTAEALNLLRPVLENPAIEKVGQNVKYDYLVLKRNGVTLVGPIFDTMVAHYLIAPESAHNLDAISLEFLNYQKIPISDLLGEGRSQKSMRDISIEAAGPYACEDADVTLQLAERLREKLAEDGLLQIAEDIEFPLIPVLAEMEWMGVRVDAAVLQETSAQLAEQLKTLEIQIYEAAGQAFKIGSTKQLGVILFEQLGLPVIEKTGKGQPSTNERVLNELAAHHDLPGLLLDWRKMTKLKNTYVDTLPELIHPETGRIHTQFNQTITATGRLSSSNPNLQNIPIRADSGREIRRAFVPAEGFQLMAADYAQIELRIIASMSEDAELMAAFTERRDIHTATAALLFDVPPDAVTRDMRRKAKEVNYGIPYGISPFGLAQRLRIPVEEARHLIGQYQQRYPDVTRLLNHLIQHAREKGYVETLLGRRRYIPTINVRNFNRRSAAERMAVNMPVQGTQADMIKLAMIRIAKKLKTQNLRSRMILQVHDELLFEVPPEEVTLMTELVQHEMIHALPLNVPIEIGIGIGDDWLSAH